MEEVVGKREEKKVISKWSRKTVYHSDGHTLLLWIGVCWARDGKLVTV